MQADRNPPTMGMDQVLIFCTIVLLLLGAVMVYSATVAVDSKTLALNTTKISKHLIHIVLGLVVMVAAMFTPLEWLKKYCRWGLIFCLVLLAILLVPGVGDKLNGSQRWLNFGLFNIQPSELMKVVALVYFADYLARKKEDLHLFKVGIINIGVVVGIIGFLLLMQPDFGTTVVLVTTVAGMMFLAGVRFWHYLVSVSVAAAVMTAIFWAASYRVNRFMSFRDPWADPYGSGFQLSQALIAIGRGEWLGAGLGNSIQKLFYLPHAGNDFLIAVIGEELGAVGIFTILIIFALVLWRTFALGSRALNQGNRFAGFLAQGIGLLITFQALVHIAVNIGLLPTKGLTLPLMSYGGSSMISTLLAIGLLFAIDRQTQNTRQVQ